MRFSFGLPDSANRFPWQAICLPELFLGIMSCFWFLSNTPKPNMFDSRSQRLVIFLVYLVICAMLKAFLYLGVFRRSGEGRLSWSFLSFFLAMIELGCFFDLYIVGYSDTRTLPVIIDYVVYWYIPLIMILVMAGIVYLYRGRARLPFLRNIHAGHARKRRRGQPTKAEKAGALLKTCSERLRNPAALILLLLLYTGVGALLFLRFRHVSSSNLAALNARNKLCEGIKLLLFVLLYLFRAARRHRDEPKETGISGKTCAILSFLSCIITAGLYLLGGESGSAIIMVLFSVLMVVYFFSTRWGFVLAEMGAAVYITGFILERRFRADGYPVLISETIGLERWNRLFHLEAFPQVLEMRTVLRQSDLLRGLVPYNVSMTGKPFTRIEDFSYLNLVTVFGRLAAIAVIAYYVLLLLRAFFRIDDLVRRKSAGLPANLKPFFMVSQYMCLYIVTHALVHVISNLAFLFFTGVPLPFVSKGLSNLAVVLIFSARIIACLRWEETHAKEKKKPARSDR